MLTPARFDSCSAILLNGNTAAPNVGECENCCRMSQEEWLPKNLPKQAAVHIFVSCLMQAPEARAEIPERNKSELPFYEVLCTQNILSPNP